MAIERRASKRSKSGYTYRVRYPDASRPGHWLSQTFDDHDDAIVADAHWRVEQRKGRLAMLDAGSELLGDYTGEWLKAWVRSPGKGSPTKAKKTIRETKRIVNGSARVSVYLTGSSGGVGTIAA